MLLRVYLDHEGLRAFDRDVVDGKGRADKVLFVNTNNHSVPPDQYRGEAVRMRRHNVWRMVQRYGRRVDIPERELHPHAFRHLVGVQLAEAEEDLLVRQELLGHSDPKSTSIYTAMAMVRKARVLDRAGPLSQMKTPVSELLKRL
jgi:site-specific recombinase XerD